jgi:hypothetical protein
MVDLSSKVDQSWWGGRLACVGDSLITYVITFHARLFTHRSVAVVGLL